MPENSPKSYKNDNSVPNESHNVLIENTRRNENELSNQGNLLRGIVNWSGAAWSILVTFFFLFTNNVGHMYIVYTVILEYFNIKE